MSQNTNELKYTQTHEWIKNEQDDLVTIGITEHAQSLLGDMVFVELPEVGHQIAAGEEICVVESVKAASDVYAPISGVVVAINQQLTDNPELVNQDPYGAGWLIKIKQSNPVELSLLLDENKYQNEIAKEH